jgi:hypothetical protein
VGTRSNGALIAAHPSPWRRGTPTRAVEHVWRGRNRAFVLDRRRAGVHQVVIDGATVRLCSWPPAKRDLKVVPDRAGTHADLGFHGFGGREL